MARVQREQIRCDSTQFNRLALKVEKKRVKAPKKCIITPMNLNLSAEAIHNALTLTQTRIVNLAEQEILPPARGTATLVHNPPRTHRCLFSLCFHFILLHSFNGSESFNPSPGSL